MTDEERTVCIADTFESDRAGDVRGARLDVLAEIARHLHNSLLRKLAAYRESEDASTVQDLIGAEDILSRRAVSRD